MARITVKFKVSPKRLDQIVNNDKVKRYAAETFYRYMYEYIPIYTGAMANSVVITPNGIWFQQPYAKNLWNGVDKKGHKIQIHTMVHPETPGNATFTPAIHPKATTKWGVVALKNHRDDIIREIEQFIEVQR